MSYELRYHPQVPYRKLRVGDYRVIFRVDENIVFILAILHRKEVYQRARRRTT